MKLLCLAMLAVVPFLCEAVSKGIVKIEGSAKGITGIVNFEQSTYGDARKVTITGTFKNLSVGKHGLYISEYGDISNGCLSVGNHLKGSGTTHGLPGGATSYAGILGNVDVTSATADATFSVESTLITLCGNKRVIGLSLVVTEFEDDGTPAGTAGGKAIACGVIGKANVSVAPGTT